MTSAPVIINGGFDRAKADAALAAGDADLVSFGVPYIANPDLAQRLRTGAALNKPDPSTFYVVGPRASPTIPRFQRGERKRPASPGPLRSVR